jgi:hypothetical protein
LGVDLDDRLTFDINIEEICKKICSDKGALRRIKPFVPQTSLVTLYKSLIQPYFDYCSPLWDTCDKILKDKLQILQNRAARVIKAKQVEDLLRDGESGWINNEETNEIELQTESLTPVQSNKQPYSQENLDFQNVVDDILSQLNKMRVESELQRNEIDSLKHREACQCSYDLIESLKKENQELKAENDVLRERNNMQHILFNVRSTY